MFNLCRPTAGDYDETIDSLHQSLTAPAFTYIFPLLEQVLRNNGQKVNGSEEAIKKTVEIIVEHAQMRAIPGDSAEHLVRA